MTGIKTTLISVAIAIIVAAFTMCGLTLPAHATANTTTIDLDATGSISALLQTSEGSHPTNGTLLLYQVANLNLNDGDMVYTYTDAFSGCELSLEDLQSASLSGDLSAYVTNNNISATAQTDITTDGSISFENLSVGLYLLSQGTLSTGYAAIDSFLVSIPLNVDDEWIYNVDASPKMQEMQTISTPDTQDTDTGEGDTTETDNQKLNTAVGATNDTLTTPSSKTTSPTTTTTKPQTAKQASSTASTQETIPQTGQLNWPTPVLIVAGIICIVIGLVMSRKKKAHAA